MDFILIWFILTGGNTYIPYQEVHKTDMSCGLEGKVVGVQLDRTINPTRLYWPDPGFENLHCEVFIGTRISGLIEGKYHIATTIIGDGSSTPYIGHDPHISVDFMIVKQITKPSKPGKVIVIIKKGN